MALAEGRGTTDTGQCASDQDDWVAHLVILALCSALPAEHGSGCSDSELETGALSAGMLALKDYVSLPSVYEKDFLS
jgi:hypothetical protein